MLYLIFYCPEYEQPYNKLDYVKMINIYTEVQHFLPMKIQTFNWICIYCFADVEVKRLRRSFQHLPIGFFSPQY